MKVNSLELLKQSLVIAVHACPVLQMLRKRLRSGLEVIALSINDRQEEVERVLALEQQERLETLHLKD